MKYFDSKEKKYLTDFLLEQMPLIYNKLNESDSDIFKKIDTYEGEKGKFISNFRKIPLGSESFIFVLRKWNSYTPSLPIFNTDESLISQHSVGGGYFLYIQSEGINELKPGYGLVIDPGYNFIHNFGLAGFSLDDIDGVLITHAHNDHTNDFESLLSILFQRNNRYLNGRSFKKIDLFLNVGSFKKFSNYLDLATNDEKNYIGEVNVMSPGGVVKIPNRDDISCKIISLFTKHHEIVTASYSLGLCIVISDRNILFTGDTGWDFNITAKNDEILIDNGVFNHSETNIDVLICHIGTIKQKEFNIKNSEKIEQYFYDKHLGILGTISAVYHYKPELCIISEFGEELTELRQPLVDEINKVGKLINSDSSCLPGDIGLAIFLDSKKVIDYLNKELVPWMDLRYVDIKEKSGQRKIVYFSSPEGGSLENHEGVVVANGLDIFRSDYKNRIFEKIHYSGADKHRLLRDIGSFRFDSSDPSSSESSIEEINDLLIAFSCTNNSPEELLPLLRNECNIWSILLFFNAYYLNNRFLLDFALTTDNFGYGVPNDQKSNEEKILLSELSGELRRCIDFYLGNNIDDAKNILKEINSVSIENIWAKLSSQQKISVLFERPSLVISQHIDKSSIVVCRFIERYNNINQKLYLNLEAFKIKYFSPDERCWKGAMGVGLEQLEANIGIVDKELLAECRVELEKLKFYRNSINDIDDELGAFIEKINIFLKSIDYEVIKVENVFSDALLGVLILDTLRDENKVGAEEVSTYLDLLDQIFKSRED